MGHLFSPAPLFRNASQARPQEGILSPGVATWVQGLVCSAWGLTSLQFPSLQGVSHSPMHPEEQPSYKPRVPAPFHKPRVLPYISQPVSTLDLETSGTPVSRSGSTQNTERVKQTLRIRRGGGVEGLTSEACVRKRVQLHGSPGPPNPTDTACVTLVPRDSAGHQPRLFPVSLAAFRPRHLGLLQGV